MADEIALVRKTPSGYLKPEYGETLPFDYLFRRWEENRGSPGLNAKSVFLTFDDGPAFCSGGILDLLALHGHKATFFVIGRNLTNPRLRSFALRALLEGHDIGNHSYNHPDFSTISAKRAEKEIVSTYGLIDELVKEAGVDAERQNRFFRFPYGAAGSRSNYQACQDLLSALNYQIAWWNLDTNDWRMELAWFPRPASTVINSLKAAKPKNVVLLHERTKTMKNLGTMLHVVESRGLVSVPLSDYLFGEERGPRIRTASATANEAKLDSKDFLAELLGGLLPQGQTLARPHRSVSVPASLTRYTLW
ncbi:MAG: polysaccharide deacetylase family protein [Desulfomonilaceae bacterium]